MSSSRMAILAGVAMVVALAAPSSHAQYRKIQSIWLDSIKDKKGMLNPDGDRSAMVEATRKINDSTANIISTIKSCGSQLQDERKDQILAPAQEVQRAAETLKDKISSLGSKLDGGGDVRDECAGTVKAIEELDSRVDTFMRSVDDHRDWLQSEIDGFNGKIMDAVNAHLRNRDALNAATQKKDGFESALASALKDQQSADTAYGDACKGYNDLVTQFAKEKDSDKAGDLAKQIESAMSKVTDASAKVDSANASCGKAEVDLAQAEQEVNKCKSQYDRSFTVMQQTYPRSKALTQWKAAFDREFK